MKEELASGCNEWAGLGWPQFCEVLKTSTDRLKNEAGEIINEANEKTIRRDCEYRMCLCRENSLADGNVSGWKAAEIKMPTPSDGSESNKFCLVGYCIQYQSRNNGGSISVEANSGSKPMMFDAMAFPFILICLLFSKIFKF